MIFSQAYSSADSLPCRLVAVAIRDAISAIDAGRVCGIVNHAGCSLCVVYFGPRSAEQQSTYKHTRTANVQVGYQKNSSLVSRDDAGKLPVYFRSRE